MVHSFDITLLFVLREELIGAVGRRRGGDHHGNSVGGFGGRGGGFVERPVEAMRRPREPLARRRQRVAFRSTERDQLPAEEAGRVAFAEQSDDLPLNAFGRRLRVAAVQFAGQFGQTGADRRDVVVAPFAFLPFARGAVNEPSQNMGGTRGGRGSAWCVVEVREMIRAWSRAHPSRVYCF